MAEISYMKQRKSSNEDVAFGPYFDDYFGRLQFCLLTVCPMLLSAGVEPDPRSPTSSPRGSSQKREGLVD